MTIDERLYEVDCQGHDTTKSHREPHKYLRSEPQHPRSHGLCPECKKQYDQEIEEYKTRITKKQ